MSRIAAGSAIAGVVVFAASLVLFIPARLLSDDLGRGVFLTFIGLPVLVVASLIAGWVAAVRGRRVLGVFGAVGAAILGILFAAILISPINGLNAGVVYLVYAGFAAVATAGGYLICVVGVPEEAGT